MFLATKLFLPPLAPGTVERSRLYASLDASWAAGTRLILLSAPPGYGKTTLLSGWVQSRRVPCAWAALDAGDNDPARFFMLVLRALEAHIPGLEELLPLLSVPQVSNFESIAAEIVNRAAQATSPVLLALDDYHAITAPAVHGPVRLLVNHLPPQLRLAVLTREDPPFNLPQMRVRRQMLEIRARELTFSTEEGQSLLVEEQALPLDAGQVEMVMERTEGWAAGLQLAALALRDHAEPAQLLESFGGSHHFVLDYLVGEVLDRLLPDLRSFLCRSAVLDRFNAGLCDAALEVENSRECISRAASANLFLVPLDDQSNWYRYHHLMADILKAEVSPDDRRGINKRAAAWFHEQEQPLEAIGCALEAGAYDLASPMIQTAALPAAENGMMVTALGWLDALPQEILLANPDLCVFRAWFLTFTGRFQEAAAWIGQIPSQAPDFPPPLAGLLSGMQAWMRTLTGEKLNLVRLKEAYAKTEGRFPYFAPMMLLAIGQAQREDGDFAGALRSFDEGASLAETSSGAISALIIRNNQAFLLNESGERQVAQQICQDAIEQYSSAGKPGLLAGIPMIPYGCFLYESGKLDEAHSILTQAINLVRRLGLYDVLTAPANHALQYVLFDLGRLDEALSLNKEVHRRAHKAGLKVVADEAELMASWLNSLAGRDALAVQWARTHPLPDIIAADPRHYSPLMLHARVLSQTGSGERAITLLSSILENSRLWGSWMSWVRASVELAQVHLSLGQIHDALEVLTSAVECAERMEFRQVFRRYAPTIAPLLERLRARFPVFIESIVTTAPHPASILSLVETLTEREREILRLVAAGLSNGEIADRLYLTTGTVKWYLNQLFGKLGVNRRTEAVARARELGLL